MLQRISRVLVCIGIALSPMGVHAQSEGGTERVEASTPSEHDAEARAAFVAGARLYAAGEFDPALASFQRAYELSERPRLLYNIGQCHDRLRNDREALIAFESYLSAAPDVENGESVAARIEILRQRVARSEGEPTAAGSEGSSVVEEWWFWTIVSVVVVGATIGIVAAATYAPGANPPIAGDGGRIVTALVTW